MMARTIPVPSALLLSVLALLLTGCFQEQERGVHVPDLDSPKAPVSAYVEQLIEMGYPEANIHPIPDPAGTGDTVYLIATLVPEELKAKGVLTTAVAFRKQTLDKVREKAAKPDKKKGKRSEDKLADLAEAGLPVPAAKASHVRWSGMGNHFDVKSLHEVNQIRVFIPQTGSEKIGPNWTAAARSAMTNWNNAPGVAVSFVETFSTSNADLILRGGFSFEQIVGAVFPTMDPWVESHLNYGVDFWVNVFYEHSGVPHAQKTAAMMNMFGLALNMTLNQNHGQTLWGSVVGEHIPGTPTWEEWSVFNNFLPENQPGVFTAGDRAAIRQLYPANALLAKTWNHALINATNTGFTTVATDVNTFQKAGDTIIYLRHNGTLWRKIKNASATQLWPATGSNGNLASFFFSKGFLAARNTLGVLYTRTPTGNWVNQGSGNLGYRLSGERLLIYNPSTRDIHSKYLVSNPSSWVLEWWGTEVTDYQIQDGRLVIVDGGHAWGKDYYNNWVHLWSNQAGTAWNAYLSDTHIGLRVRLPGQPSDGLIYKQGMHGTWQYPFLNKIFLPSHVDFCGDKMAVLSNYYELFTVNMSTGQIHDQFFVPEGDLTYRVRLTGPFCDYVTRTDFYYTDLSGKYSIGLNTGYFVYANNIMELEQRP